MQDPIVMKKDLCNFLKFSCHTKFRFAEREAQCILGECGLLTDFTWFAPLIHVITSLVKLMKSFKP